MGRDKNSFLLVFLLFFCPGVAEGDRAVYDDVSRFCVGVDGEVSESFELEVVAGLEACDVGLHESVDFFERFGVEVEFPVLLSAWVNALE